MIVCTHIVSVLTINYGSDDLLHIGEHVHAVAFCVCRVHQIFCTAWLSTAHHLLCCSPSEVLELLLQPLS